jgi:hypothetical protein
MEDYMRRTFPLREARFAALALVVTMTLVGAGDPRKKKKLPEPPPPKVEETVGNLAIVVTGEVAVEGVGLVVGLNNTGSNPPPSAQRGKLLNEMRKAGVDHPDKWLENPACAMVVVRAILPHGVGTKDPIDVDLEIAPGTGTTSLAGGRLLMTELAPVVNTAAGAKEGKVLATAGGPVMTGDTKNPAKLTIGTVLGGGRVKNDIPYNLVIRDERRSARTSKLVQDVIAQRFHENNGIDQKGMANAKTDNLIILKVPKVYHHNQVRYFQVIQNLPVVNNPALSDQRLLAWGKELLDPKTAGRAALKLEGAGPNAIPKLKEGLAAKDPNVRFFSAEALAYLSNVDGAMALAETATNRPEMRSYAVKALAAMDQSAGLMRLRELMAKGDVDLRYGAFDALRTFDPTDPFLGQVSLADPEEPLDKDDRLAIQLDGVRPRRRPTREEPFKLYVVDCDGPPLVHITRNLRAEVVVFGRGLSMLTPVVLGSGGAVLLNAAEGDKFVQISRITKDNLDDGVNRVTSPLQLASVIQQAVRIGATYPEVVQILTDAFNQKNLPGPLVADALPIPNKAYTELQLVGAESKKDPAVTRTKAETEKETKPGMFSRIRNPFKK